MRAVLVSQSDDSLRGALEERGFEVVAVTRTLSDALALVAESSPDVVILSPDPSTLAERGAGALSQRELQVLRLLASGKENSEIARELVISQKTVKNHVSKILAKLRLENRIQAAVYAVRNGLA